MALLDYVPALTGVTCVRFGPICKTAEGGIGYMRQILIDHTDRDGSVATEIIRLWAATEDALDPYWAGAAAPIEKGAQR